MAVWWDGLLSLEKFFYFVAVPSTLVLFIQFVFSLLGLSGDSDLDVGGLDTDVDLQVDFDLHDVDMHSMDMNDVDISGLDFQFVSFRTIIAFLTVFSWTGIVLQSAAFSTILTILISVIAGLFAMFVIGYLFYLASKLQSSGNIIYKNAIGATAEVYIPISSDNSKQGKVQVIIQERLIEANAISKNGKSFKTGEIVKIIDIVGLSTLVVDTLD